MSASLHAGFVLLGNQSGFVTSSPKRPAMDHLRGTTTEERVVAIDEVAEQVWISKHDGPAVPVIRNAPRTVYPKSLDELIETCSTWRSPERVGAAGSHWAPSASAISDSVCRHA
jgi:hypothetical protein